MFAVENLMFPTQFTLSLRRAALPAWACLALACAPPSEQPSAGTQTNWLQTCETHEECGLGNACLCGSCTRIVENDPTVCDDLPGATAVQSDHPGAIALCGGQMAPVRTMCLARCSDESCPEGSNCQAGVCTPGREPTMSAAVDVSTLKQELIGFGGVISYNDFDITTFSNKSELLDAMFKDTGLNMIRLRNAYAADESFDISAQVEIYEAAQERLKDGVMIILSSSSPPPSLKQNGNIFCEGNPDTCTLTRDDKGNFDYAALGNHFRGSLQAYADADVGIDFLSIQNDPNYVPPTGAMIETCRFLPQEGTMEITVGGKHIDMEYPGYREALDATLEAIADLPDLPKIAGPEATGVRSSADFISALDLENIDALAHHMYGLDPFDPDLEAVADLRKARERSGLPLMQTEMGDDGLETALLIQEALVDLGSSAYLQTTYVAPAGLSTPDTTALIALNEDGSIDLQEPYHAMLHYSRFTGPGWQRVEVEVDRASVRTSAWKSPDDSKLTVILVNPQNVEEVVELDLGDKAEDDQLRGEITRTVFGAEEQSAPLGSVLLSRGVLLPAESIVTISLDL